uniref:Recombinase domain-containing protein n=1 Tax=Caenorhabditis tropicalis TaxID=1561998 RepID=A0A1I7T0F6_9PELO
MDVEGLTQVEKEILEQNASLLLAVDDVKVHNCIVPACMNLIETLKGQITMKDVIGITRDQKVKHFHPTCVNQGGVAFGLGKRKSKMSSKYMYVPDMETVCYDGMTMFLFTIARAVRAAIMRGTREIGRYLYQKRFFVSGKLNAEIKIKQEKERQYAEERVNRAKKPKIIVVEEFF